jgi:hypothetical protein
MTHCDQEIYNDENVEVNEEQECDKSTMMDEINEVFSDKHRCLTPPEGSSTVPPTSSSLQATPENKKGTKGNRFPVTCRIHQVNPFYRNIQ